MTKKFSRPDKKLIKHILQRGLELLDTNELADFYDLGLLAAHLEFIAASSPSDTEDRQEHFIYGLNGDSCHPELVVRFQEGCDLLPRFEKHVPEKQKWKFAQLFEHRYEDENAIPKFDVNTLVIP